MSTPDAHVPMDESDVPIPTPKKDNKKKKTKMPTDPTTPEPVLGENPPEDAGKKKKKKKRPRPEEEETTTVTEPETKAKKRKAPKKPRVKSAYAFFVSAWHGSLDEADKKSATLGVLSKRCAEAWKALADKSEYEAKATADRARIQAEAPPRRPLTAYLRFSIQERIKLKEAEPELTFPQISKRCGEAWKALAPEAKAAWKAGEEQPVAP